MIELYTFYENGRKITIDFTNDVVFKILLCSEDSLPLLAFLIHAVTKCDFKDLQLSRNEDDGETYEEKNTFMDVYAKDQEGHDIIIEMQKSVITNVNGTRFQIYGFKRATAKSITGKKYHKVSTVHMIVFTTTSFNNQFYSRFSMMDDHGKQLPGNLIYLHVISLPFINDIVRKKMNEHEQITDMEILSYMFKNSNCDDIMEVMNEKQKEMIQFMETKYNALMHNPHFLTQAEEQAFYEAEQKANEEYHLKRLQNMQEQLAQTEVELNQTTDQLNLTTDQLNLTTDQLNLATNELNQTKSELEKAQQEIRRLQAMLHL